MHRQVAVEISQRHERCDVPVSKVYFETSWMLFRNELSVLIWCVRVENAMHTVTTVSNLCNCGYRYFTEREITKVL